MLPHRLSLLSSERGSWLLSAILGQDWSCGTGCGVGHPPIREEEECCATRSSSALLFFFAHGIGIRECEIAEAWFGMRHVSD